MEREWDEDVEKPEVPEEDNSVEGLAKSHYEEEQRIGYEKTK